MRIQQSRLGKIGVAIAVAGMFAVTGVSAQKPASPDKPAQKPATSERPAQQENRPGGGIGDGWITMKIHAQFVTENALDGSDIDVDTRNKVVTLTGTVASDAGRARAVSIAKATEGVTSVNDKLRVAPAGDDKDRDKSAAAGAATKETGRQASGTAKEGGRRVNDGYIKSKVYAQFSTEDAFENSDIDVTVKSGVVTLSGRVASTAARTRAAAIAKSTEGVKDVKNALKVAKQ